jgi:hypothetical protein
MISPLTLLVAENRLSWTSITPMAQVLVDLPQISEIGWAISAMGWYDTLTFRIPNINEARALIWLDRCLGRYVSLKVYDKLLWEGFVNDVTIELPGVTISRSLDEMNNRAYVNYSQADVSTPKQLGPYQNLTSQGIYGVKSFAIEGGTMSDAQAANFGNTYLTTNGMPPATQQLTDTGGYGANILVNCKGYYYTLYWRYTRSDTTGTQDTSLTISDLQTTLGSEFPNSTISLATTGVTAQRNFPEWIPAWEAMSGMAAYGTSNYRKYFIGLKANRVLTGWEEPTTISYIKIPTVNGKFFSAGTGQWVPYWNVLPATWFEARIQAGGTALPTPYSATTFFAGSCIYDGVAHSVTPSAELQSPNKYVPTSPKSDTTEGTAPRYPGPNDPWDPWTYGHIGARLVQYPDGRTEWQYAGEYKKLQGWNQFIGTALSDKYEERLHR